MHLDATKVQEITCKIQNFLVGEYAPHTSPSGDAPLAKGIVFKLLASKSPLYKVLDRPVWLQQLKALINR